MVDTLTRSDQSIDANLATLSRFGRFWLLTVAALDVLLVISSMVALNAALPDIAVETGRDADATHLDRGRLHAGLGLPPAACRRARRSVWAAGGAARRVGDLLAGVARSGVSRQPGPDHHCARRRGCRRGADHAGNPVAVDRSVPEERAQQGRWHLGRRREFQCGLRVPGNRAAAAVLLVAIHLLRVHSVGHRPVHPHVHDSVVARRVRHPSGLGRRRADRFGARGIRVRRHRSARAGLDASDRLGVHDCRCRTRGRCSGWWSCGADIPCWTSAYSADPEFAIGAIGITFLFFANFGFFFVAMQYLQLVLGYSPLRPRSPSHRSRCRSWPSAQRCISTCRRSGFG